MRFPNKTIQGLTLSRLNPATTIHLERIIKKFNVRNILEVGSYVGMGSTQIFLKYCDHITCIENFSTNLEFEVEVDVGNIKKYSQYDLFQKITQESSKIKLINEDSKTAFQKLEGQKFDAVFIDGSHYYPDVFFDIINYYDYVKEDGVLIGDDCQGYLKDFDKDFIIENLNEKNTVNIKNYKYSQIHPGPIMAVNDLIKNVKFDNRKIRENKIDLGFSWIWYYKKNFINNYLFKRRKNKLKEMMQSDKNNFRHRFFNYNDIK